MLNIEIFTGTLGLLIAIAIVYLVRRDQMHARFTMWWLAVAGLAILFGFFPRLLDLIGGFLGIAYPPILAVILAVAALVLKILFADLERSKMRRDMLRLTQRVLILEQAIRDRDADAPTPEAATGSRPDHISAENRDASP